MPYLRSVAYLPLRRSWELASSTIFYLLLLNLASLKALGTLPEDGNVMPNHVGATIHN
jgi:hypothetical protein